MPRAKQRTPELREQVLEVASMILAREGVAGFTTRKVAAAARTSTPAVYELFGDRAGLLRAVFFAGFETLRGRLGMLAITATPRTDLIAVVQALRAFVRENPVLAELMFSRPFADFDPGAAELEAGAAVRQFIVARVRRCVQAGILAGDEADIAHALLALTRGLLATEIAGWLGRSKASVERRWRLAIRALLDGLKP